MLLSAYLDRRGTLWVVTAAGIDRLNGDRFVAVSKTDNAAVGVGGFGFAEDHFGALSHLDPSVATFMFKKIVSSHYRACRRSQGW